MFNVKKLLKEGYKLDALVNLYLVKTGARDVYYCYGDLKYYGPRGNENREMRLKSEKDFCLKLGFKVRLHRVGILVSNVGIRGKINTERLGKLLGYPTYYQFEESLTAKKRINYEIILRGKEKIHVYNFVAVKELTPQEFNYTKKRMEKILDSIKNSPFNNMFDEIVLNKRIVERTF